MLKQNRSRPKRQSAREFLELQRLIAGVVMRPLARNDGMQAKAADGRSMKSVAAGIIKPNDRLTSFERLEIYNRQYWFPAEGLLLRRLSRLARSSWRQAV